MLFLFFACRTGSNYPRKNATATCKTGYACIDQDVIEDFLGYDSIDECINDLEGQIQSTASALLYTGPVGPGVLIFKPWAGAGRDRSRTRAAHQPSGRRGALA